MEAIAWEAKQRMRGTDIMRGPIFLQLRATFERPKDHYSKAGTLKQDAPRFKTTKPDCDNLVKLAKDALNKIVYRDDAQVVRVHAEKVFGYPEG
jgi:Holliday junction resolvase RusA-like endonuclease